MIELSNNLRSGRLNQPRRDDKVDKEKMLLPESERLLNATLAKFFRLIEDGKASVKDFTKYVNIITESANPAHINEEKSKAFRISRYIDKLDASEPGNIAKTLNSLLPNYRSKLYLKTILADYMSSISEQDLALKAILSTPDDIMDDLQAATSTQRLANLKTNTFVTPEKVAPNVNLESVQTLPVVEIRQDDLNIQDENTINNPDSTPMSVEPIQNKFHLVMAISDLRESTPAPLAKEFNIGDFANIIYSLPDMNESKLLELSESLKYISDEKNLQGGRADFYYQAMYLIVRYPDKLLQEKIFGKLQDYVYGFVHDYRAKVDAEKESEMSKLLYTTKLGIKNTNSFGNPLEGKRLEGDREEKSPRFDRDTDLKSLLGNKTNMGVGEEAPSPSGDLWKAMANVSIKKIPKKDTDSLKV